MSISMSGPLSRKLDVLARERARAQREAERAAMLEQMRREEEKREADKRAWEAAVGIAKRAEKHIEEYGWRRHLESNPELPSSSYVWIVIAQEIRAYVAAKHGLTVMDIQAETRNREVVHARQEAIFLTACETPLSYTRIARLYGGKDHTTIYHSVRKHAARAGLTPPRGLSLVKMGRQG